MDSLDDSDVEVYVEAPPIELKCPVCLDFVRDPVITSECGHTFCRMCLATSMATSSACPSCRTNICVSKISCNRMVAGLVESLRVYCRWGLKLDASGQYVVDPEGCPARLRRGDRKSHERDCCYALSSCPNASKGCNFVGPRSHVERHKNEGCVFERLKGFMDATNSHIEQLQRKVDDQQSHISVLSRKVKTYENTLTRLTELITSIVNHNSVAKDSDCEPSSQSAFETNEQQMLSTTAAAQARSIMLNRNSFSRRDFSNNKNLQRIDESVNGCHSSSGSSSPPQDISGIVSEHPDQAGLKSIKDWYAFEQTSQSLLDAVLNAVKQQSAVTEIASSVDQEFSTSCNEFELGANVACVKTLELHDDTVEALATARGLILSASWDNTVKVWDGNFDCIKTLNCHIDVRELLATDEYLYCGCGSGSILQWDLNSFDLALCTRLHTDDVLALQRYQNALYSGSSDYSIKVWDIRTLSYKQTLNGHRNWVFALASAHDKLFSGSSDSSVKVWCPETGRCLTTLESHSDQVRALAVSDSRLFTGSYDCTIKVWDIRSMELIKTLRGNNEVFGLGTAGKYLFGGDEYGTISVWDLNTLECTHLLHGHDNSVYSFVTAGDSLLSGSSDTTIKVWQ